MIAEYGYTLRRALWSPLTSIYAIMPARRVRFGDDSMPSPADLAAAKARATAKAFLAQHYTILPPQPKN